MKLFPLTFFFIILATTFAKKQTPVSQLSIPAYMGHWYQMYTCLSVIDTSGKDGICAEAYYKFQSPNTVLVFNSETVNKTRQYKNIRGQATIPDFQEPGKLKLHLDGVPFTAEYWIVALGPLVNNQYQWAMVSDEYGFDLFIIARDRSDFKSKYESEALSTAKKLGFVDFWNKPIATYQGQDCTFQPAPWHIDI